MARTPRKRAQGVLDLESASSREIPSGVRTQTARPFDQDEIEKLN